jgi:hypothetical protein
VTRTSAHSADSAFCASQQLVERSRIWAHNIHDMPEELSSGGSRECASFLVVAPGSRSSCPSHDGEASAAATDGGGRGSAT